MDSTKIRNTELTSLQLQRLKKLPQYFRINQKQFILYNLVDKESNSGLFKNQRFLILNTKDEYLGYISKVPSGVIPFYSEQEINSLVFKEKLFTKEKEYLTGQQFVLRQLSNKNGILIKLEKGDKSLQWVLYFSNKELMQEWFKHVNFLFTKTKQEVYEQYHKIQPLDKLQQQKEIGPKIQPLEKKLITQDKELVQKLNISQLKKSEDQEMNSDYNDFSEKTPLGDFVRENINYNTETAKERRQPGGIYNTSFKSENNNADSSKQKQKPESFKNNSLKQQLNKYTNGNKLSNLLKKPFQQDQINNQISKFRQIQWNELYYKQNMAVKIYFDFVDECNNFIVQFTDRLPIDRQLYTFQRDEEYFLKENNGVLYKIAYQSNEQSLIYDLIENVPIVRNDYHKFQQLKRQYYSQKELFFIEKDKKPALICYIQYKGLAFYCKAAQRQKKININQSNRRINDSENTVLKKLQKVQLHITSSSDFKDVMRHLNVSILNWKYMYNTCQVPIFKKQFLNQIYSEIFLNILRGELCQLYDTFPVDQFQNVNVVIVNDVVIDSIVMVINRLFSSGPEATQLWDVILKQTERLYDIKSTQQDILANYMFYASICKIGLEMNQTVNLKRDILSSKRCSLILRQDVKSFVPLIDCLKYQNMSPVLQQIKQNLVSDTESNQQLEMLISNQQFELIPNIINYFQPKVNIQLSKTKPYDSARQNILIYRGMLSDKPQSCSYQLALSAINWLLESNNRQAAFDLSFVKVEQILFWTGRVPMISLFYDNIAEYYIARGQIEKGIQQIKKSVENITDIFGESSLKVLERKNQLYQLFLELNKKQQCLKELHECKRICQSNSLNQLPVFLQALVNISKITLSMGRFNDSINNSMHCLKCLQSRAMKQSMFTSQSQIRYFLEAAQLILRGYQLTNRKQELFEIVSLFAERCQSVQNPKIWKRLLKLLIFPYLKCTSLRQSQIWLLIVQELSTTYKQTCLKEDSLFKLIKQNNITGTIHQKIKYYFKNIFKLNQEITKNRALQSFHYNYKQILENNSKREVEVFLRDIFLLCNFIGIGYIQAMLKDVYYQ